MFYVNVHGRKLQVFGVDYFTSGSVGLQMQFEFDDEWNGLSKYATFEAGNVGISLLIEDGLCIVPHEALADPTQILKIGIYGTNGTDVVIPTIWAAFEIHKGATLDSGSPASPTITPIEQLSGEVRQLSNELDNKLTIPSGGSTGDAIVKAANGYGWKAIKGAFWASYGTTEYNEIGDALNDGLLVACLYNGRCYYYEKARTDDFYFTAVEHSGSNITLYYVVVSLLNTWSNGSVTPSGGGSGGSDDTYEATYGTTTTAEINTAASAGKLCYCVYNGRTYYLMSWTYTALVRAAKFYAIVSTSELYYVSISGESYWANGTETIAGNKADKVTITTVSTAGSVSQALDAGKIYDFTGALTDLTITLNSATAPAQYHFRFDSGSTAPTLTLPQTVTMPSGFQVEANKHYEIDILDGYGVAQSW